MGGTGGICPPPHFKIMGDLLCIGPPPPPTFTATFILIGWSPLQTHHRSSAPTNSPTLPSTRISLTSNTPTLPSTRIPLTSNTPTHRIPLTPLPLITAYRRTSTAQTREEGADGDRVRAYRD